jgi:hypothetical protein
MISAARVTMVVLACLPALAAPAAVWAGSGTVTFDGAVVVPTCTVRDVNASQLPAATPSRVEACPSKAGTSAVGSFTETRLPISAAGGDPLLDYFVHTCKPAVESGGDTLLVRTYL